MIEAVRFRFKDYTLRLPMVARSPPLPPPPPSPFLNLSNAPNMDLPNPNYSILLQLFS